MKLFEHPDFDQAIIRAAEHFRPQALRPAIIEKDYYVTEALRIISGVGEAKIIFKGGTSLVKGWNLIQRFSEDIDIFLDPQAFEPPLGRTKSIGNSRIFATQSLAILRLPSCRSRAKPSAVSGAVTSSLTHSALAGPARFPLAFCWKQEPQAAVNLRTSSNFAPILDNSWRKPGASLKCDDEGGFSMRLLHFRRTFVEKMFAIHGKVELLKKGQPLGTYARHYYDLFQLAGQSDVMAMLKSAEYDAIKKDYDLISREHFPDSYFYPADMRFANSNALFPPAELSSVIAPEYEAQCRMLCYGAFPPWPEVQQRFVELRDLL